MTRADRQKVFDKYGGKCAYCGTQLQKGWHVDHLEPCRRIREWNGKRWVEVGFANPDSHHIDNYMPSCPSCNINKHGDTLEQFRNSIAGYVKSLNLRMVQYKMAKKYGLVEETGRPVVFYFETLNLTNDPGTNP